MTDSGRVTTRFGGKSVKSQDEHIDLGVRNEVGRLISQQHSWVMTSAQVRVDTVVLREIEVRYSARPKLPRS